MNLIKPRTSSKITTLCCRSSMSHKPLRHSRIPVRSGASTPKYHHHPVHFPPIHSKYWTCCRVWHSVLLTLCLASLLTNPTGFSVCALCCLLSCFDWILCDFLLYSLVPALLLYFSCLSSSPSTQSSVGTLPPIINSKSRVNRTHSFPGGSSGIAGAVKRRTRIPVVKTRSKTSVVEAQHVYKESVTRKKSQRKKHVEPFNNIKRAILITLLLINRNSKLFLFT